MLVRPLCSSLSLWEVELVTDDVVSSGGPVSWDPSVVSPSGNSVSVPIRLRHVLSGRYLVSLEVHYLR